MDDDSTQRWVAEFSAKARAEFQRLLVALDLADVGHTMTGMPVNTHSTTEPGTEEPRDG